MITGYTDFYYNVADMNRAVAFYQALGKILGEMDAHWGHMLIFEDLDGNVMKLMKPKH